MTTPSFRDVEQLSAYLDGQLSREESTRLETRLRAEPALGEILNDLRTARLTLGRTPNRPVPRNFIMTPRMAGIQPPVPRLVPVFSWASAFAAFLFVITLGGSLIGQLASKSAGPMLAAAPMTNQAYGLGSAPAEAATPPGPSDQALMTPTPGGLLLAAPQVPIPNGSRSVTPSTAPVVNQGPFRVWLFVWPGLALILLASALLIRWLNLRAFRRRNTEK